MEIKGTIIDVFDAQTVSDSFTKREFIVEYADNPQYPELIKFEVIQNNCDILDQFSQNDKVIVSFNLKGRKWTNKEGKDVYFNTLQAWKILSDEESVPEPVKSRGPGLNSQITEPVPEKTYPPVADDDLPF